MDKYLETPAQQGDLIKISGDIKNYVSKRDEASFVLSKKDKTGMGIVSEGGRLKAFFPVTH